MYRQIKDICTCILLYISITCTNGLLCYSCFGYKMAAQDCNIITCKLSLFDDLRTACYYQVFESGYQRRGCQNVTSELSQLIDSNMALYYCREDYCNEYSNVFLNDTRHQYKSGETQAPDLKPLWNSTADAYSSLTHDDTQKYSVYTNTFLIIAVICIIVAMIYLCYFMIKSKCKDICLYCFDPDISGCCNPCFDCCDNNTNHNSHVPYNIGNGNHNNHSDNTYSCGDTNFGGGNNVDSGGNNDGGGDCDIGGGGSDDAADCGDGDCGCGGSDYADTDCSFGCFD